jgi:hypothetical protein
VWGKPKPRAWCIIIEGAQDQKPFIQNVWVTATSKGEAIDAARARFEAMDASFVSVAEAKLAKGATLQDGETRVSGRIFFG